MTREYPKWKNVATRDRHLSRSTWYKPKTESKDGGGKGNWGRPEDYFDVTDVPLYEPFEDPAWDAPTIDNSKLRAVSPASFVSQ